jgi:hypothetical protein
MGLEPCRDRAGMLYALGARTESIMMILRSVAFPPSRARVSSLLLLLAACSSAKVAGVECATASDCSVGMICQSNHQCVSVGHSEAGGTGGAGGSAASGASAATSQGGTGGPGGLPGIAGSTASAAGSSSAGCNGSPSFDSPDPDSDPDASLPPGVSYNGLSPCALAAFPPGLFGSPPPGAASGTLAWTAAPVMAPTWASAGWQIVETPLGTADDGFAEASTAWSALWPKHQLVPFGTGMTFAPNVQHAAPYDKEAEEGVLATGFPSGDHFTQASWAAPWGLTVTGVLVPTAQAPSGSSPDFDSGPIIDTRVIVDGDLYRNGVLVDPNFDSTIPLVSEVVTDKPFAGWSHVIVIFAESTTFVPGDPGNYEFVFKLTAEGSGNGWVVHLPFVVE